jgi:putative ABC transport system permease protein
LPDDVLDLGDERGRIIDIRQLPAGNPTPYFAVRTEQNSMSRPRLNALLVGMFAAIAALLAAIGIYGLIAYSVTERTREFGIRIALGATRANVIGLVLGESAILIGAGLVLGLGAAAVGSRYLQGLLFGITPLDAPTFVATSLVFGLVAALASYVPGRRATKVDPIVALRHE